MDTRTRITALAGLLFICTGCAKYSVREQMILSKLPESYRQHRAGFAIPPTDAEVAEAIQLGTSDKDGMQVQYAHMFKPNLDTYVSLQTPIYLIADHARDCTREYREPDSDFIAYCRNLDVVRLTLKEVYVMHNLDLVSLQYNVILLRDGKRVEPLTKLLAFKAMNPFIKLDKELAAMVQGASATSQAKFEQIQTEVRKALRDIPPEAMADAPPGKQALLKYLTGQRPSQTQPDENVKVELPVTEFEGFFKASELKQPGKYEVVFRTPPRANLFITGDKERRYPVSFDTFK